jgi:hypothetical protein
MASYSDPYAGVNLEESSRIAAGGTPFVQREIDVEEDRKKSHERIASEVSDQLGIPTSKALELVTAQFESDKAQKLAKIEDSIKQANYSKDLAEARQKFAKINTRNLNAQESLDQVAQDYSYLAGSLDENISKQYQSMVDSYNKGHQSYLTSIQRYLPKGVDVREIGDESGIPDFNYARELGFATEEKRSALREGKATRLLEAKAKEDFKLAKLKQGLKLSPEALEFEFQKARVKGMARQEFPSQPSILFSAGQIPTQTTGTPMATQPAKGPALRPVPSATPDTTPLPESQPSTTTGKIQPREGQIFIQKGKKYQYSSGEYIPVD